MVPSVVLALPGFKQGLHGKKNSSPPNQWGEEETFFLTKAPGPPRKWKKQYPHGLVSCIVCIQMVEPMMMLSLFYYELVGKPISNC
jgi:hypothetical protein